MSDDDIVRKIVGADPSSSPTVRTFKPWHRPRKQFIRERQWSLMLKDLLDGFEAPRSIKYLGLPGEDLLDVRVFHDVVAERKGDWWLTYLGFNDTRDMAGALDQAVAHDLPRLRSEKSRCMPYPIESIANSASPAAKALREHGGFDVVNLDLCGSLRSKARKPAPVDALKAIVQHQINKRVEPWLLFLTTRTDSSSLDPQAHRIFLEQIASNISKSERFAKLLQDEMGLSSEQLDHLLADGGEEHTDRSGDEQRSGRIGLGIAKWLLGLHCDADWDMSAGPCYAYAVCTPRDMAALAFKFTRPNVVVTDKSGLTENVASTRAAKSEHDLACRMIKPLSRMKDVDQTLAGNQELMEDLVARTGTLLRRAGYPEDEYRAWVKTDTVDT